MGLPKVLILTPTYSGKDYCLDDFIANVKKLTYTNTEHLWIDNTDDGGKYYEYLKEKLSKELPNARVERMERGGSSREALARAQNRGRQVLLEGDYDYLFSLESDIFPKPNIIDALMRHGVDVVTALYKIGQPNAFHPGTDIPLEAPCITIDALNEKTHTMGTRMLYPEEFGDYINQGPKIVACGGWGCALVYRDVFKNIKFTYIPGHRAHSDVFFFNDCRRQKIPIVVDTDIVVDHRYSDWSLVEDR